ncbi:MAG TPA: glycosyltransferase family 10 [Candidatus Binatia bacterium]|nr:glycosyltransferase family 10 [Candidatus Binatia bacterium]
MTLFIDPPSSIFLRDQMFNESDGLPTGDRLMAPWAYLQNFLSSRGIPVHTVDYLPEKPGTSQNVYVAVGCLKNYRRLARRPDVILSAFFAMECPIVEPSLYRALPKVKQYFKRIFSWSDSPSLESFVGTFLPYEPFRWPQSFDQVHEPIWRQTNRKFLVMINANKLPRLYRRELYTERLKALEFFNRTGEVDLYGVGWDGPPLHLGRTWVPYTLIRMHRMMLRYWDRLHPDPTLTSIRRAYRGPAMSKSETLGEYTFALCFENMILKGWITEKIFDCFFAGTIPIYWGAPDIAEYVPAACFIDMRKFSGYQELRSFLKSLGQKDIRAYKEAAREYLRSPQFRPFSKEAFAEMFARIIEEDTGKRIDHSSTPYKAGHYAYDSDGADF